MISAGYKSAYQQGYSDAMRDFREKSKSDMLDEIRAEIEEITPTYHNPDWSITDLVPVSKVLDMINKYRAESEEA